jgi:hypothetical protein
VRRDVVRDEVVDEALFQRAQRGEIIDGHVGPSQGGEASSTGALA